MAKSHFADIYKFRETLGKSWIAPRAYFRADKALFFPNFIGRTATSKTKRGTTSVIRSQKVSIIRIFTSISGEKQADSYFDKPQDEIVEDGFQIIDINLPDDFVKEFIVSLFSGKIKSKFQKNPQRADRYFIARKGVSKEVKAAINLENKFTGYIYVVDQNCKIRWAACGNATEEEKAALWRAVSGVKKET